MTPRDRSGVGGALPAIALGAALWLLHAGTAAWWWIVALPAVYGAARRDGWIRAVASAAAVGAAVWGLAFARSIAGPSNHLAPKVAALFGLPSTSALAAAIVAFAAIAAGAGASAGYFLRPRGRGGCA